VKRLAAPALIVLCLLILSGCWNGKILFAMEQPFWASRNGGPRLSLSLVETSLAHGYLPRILVSGQAGSSAERLAGAVATGGYRAVVVSPLLSFDWKIYVPLQAHTRFILIGGANPAEVPTNATVLSYDRRDAFRAAGHAAGVSVRGSPVGGLGAAGGFRAAAAVAPGQRIAVLLSGAPSLDAGETDAFSEGVAGALDGARPTTRVLGDKASVKTAIEEMHRDGVRIFLLGMGSLDAWALEVLQGTGGSAVVADWAASGAFPPQVFLSVEDDIPGGIDRALAAAGRAREARGPVRLVPGRAGGVPREALSYREKE
jgi:hypothetical protein